MTLWGIFDYYDCFGDHESLEAVCGTKEEAEALKDALTNQNQADGHHNYYEVKPLEAGWISDFGQRILKEGFTGSYF